MRDRFFSQRSTLLIDFVRENGCPTGKEWKRILLLKYGMMVSIGLARRDIYFYLHYHSGVRKYQSVNEIELVKPTLVSSTNRSKINDILTKQDITLLDYSEAWCIALYGEDGIAGRDKINFFKVCSKRWDDGDREMPTKEQLDSY
jgi:hypothetical protein